MPFEERFDLGLRRTGPALPTPPAGQGRAVSSADELGFDDLHDWAEATERAVRAIHAAPLHRRVSPGECLDHFCNPLLADGSALWVTLWVEARRDPFGAIAAAVTVHRRRLLEWTTTMVQGHQRRGLVISDRDAESIAAAVLVALEGLVPVLRIDPAAARAQYGAVRERLLRDFQC